MNTPTTAVANNNQQHVLAQQNSDASGTSTKPNKTRKSKAELAASVDTKAPQSTGTSTSVKTENESKVKAASDTKAALKSRIRDLFWLEGQTRKAIKDALVKEFKDTAEETLVKWIDTIIDDEINAGTPDGNGNRYIALKDGLYKVEGFGDDSHSTRLTNFIVNSMKVLLKDDGDHKEKLFILGVEYRSVKRSITLSHDDFRLMNWHFDLFDGHAVILPGLKEYALVAIQLTASKPARPEIEYVHTGWQQINDKWLFLHADGAIGADGQHKDIKATLTGNLRNYSLPDPPADDKLKVAIRTSLKMIDVAEPSVAFPLFAEVYRAPAGDCDFTGHSSGITGSLKSALATVAQQHYGQGFDDKRLPAYWTSTVNYILDQLHPAKDVFAVLDDFVPRGTPQEQKRQHADFDRIVRAVADGAFRGRLTDDHPPRGPRGMLHTTGEVTPNGESCRSRMVDVPVSPGSVDSVKLTDLQMAGDGGVLAQAMSGYIQWLASRLPNLFGARRARIKELSYRARQLNVGEHRRTPENVANLLFGIQLFLEFAMDKEAITRDEAQPIWKRAVDAITGLASVQSSRQHEEDPVRETLRLLKVADEAGQLRFRALGEELKSNDVLGTPEIDTDFARSNDKPICWRKDRNSEWLCHPDWLWEKLIQLLAAQQRRHLLPDNKNELYRRMIARGFLPQPDELTRVTVKRQVGATSKERERVIVITQEAFARAEQSAQELASAPSAANHDSNPLYTLML